MSLTAFQSVVLRILAVAGALVYRPGHIRGVWPEIVG